eukprot:358316_1
MTLEQIQKGVDELQKSVKEEKELIEQVDKNVTKKLKGTVSQLHKELQGQYYTEQRDQYFILRIVDDIKGGAITFTKEKGTLSPGLHDCEVLNPFSFLVPSYAGGSMFSYNTSTGTFLERNATGLDTVWSI